MSRENIINNINELIKKYEDNPQFIEILEEQIDNLESIVETKIKVINEREARKKELEKEKDKFIEEFLDTINYYYIADSDLFLIYKRIKEEDNYNLTKLEDSEPDSDESDDDNDLYSYEIVPENKVWNKIMRRINENGNLSPWKQKVRIELMSKIKKRNNITLAIPDSSTIQHILSIFTSMITTHKELSKYLLTIIGDSILKKNTENIYFVNNGLYKALNILQYNINKYVKGLYLQNFKTKYHNQSYELIRYIKTNSNIDRTYLWEKLFKKHIFDIICVACHYSNRFSNAENFIDEHCISISEVESILYTVNKTKEEIIKSFETSYLESNNVLTIKVKEAYYLWKEYIIENDLPNIIYISDLTNYLDEKYINNDGIYEKLTSPKLHYIKHILDYVDEEIVIIKEKEEGEGDDIENDTIYTGKYNMLTNYEPNNYELGELYQMFQEWKKTKDITVNINEEILLNVIKHFNDKILILDDKYFYGIRCNMWNKEESVKKYIIENDNSTLKYTRYCRWCKENKMKFVVSKSYFNYIKKIGVFEE